MRIESPVVGRRSPVRDVVEGRALVCAIAVRGGRLGEAMPRQRRIPRGVALCVYVCICRVAGKKGAGKQECTVPSARCGPMTKGDDGAVGKQRWNGVRALCARRWDAVTRPVWRE